jgi:uncharacterized spore protein YtfJ
VNVPNVNEILSGARDALTVRRVFGEPIERDGVCVVPVAAVRGGAGGGGDRAGDGGGGFGLSAVPAGVYVIDGGDVTWKPAVSPNRIALGGQLVAGLALLVVWSAIRARGRR